MAAPAFSWCALCFSFVLCVTAIHSGVTKTCCSNRATVSIRESTGQAGSVQPLAAMGGAGGMAGFGVPGGAIGPSLPQALPTPTPAALHTVDMMASLTPQQLSAMTPQQRTQLQELMKHQEQQQLLIVQQLQQQLQQQPGGSGAGGGGGGSGGAMGVPNSPSLPIPSMGNVNTLISAANAATAQSEGALQANSFSKMPVTLSPFPLPPPAGAAGSVQPQRPPPMQFQPQPQLPSPTQFQSQPQLPSPTQLKQQPQLPSVTQFQPQPQLPSPTQLQQQPQLPSITQLQQQPQLPSITQFQPQPPARLQLSPPNNNLTMTAFPVQLTGSDMVGGKPTAQLTAPNVQELLVAAGMSVAGPGPAKLPTGGSTNMQTGPISPEQQQQLMFLQLQQQQQQQKQQQQQQQQHLQKPQMSGMPQNAPDLLLLHLNQQKRRPAQQGHPPRHPPNTANVSPGILSQMLRQTPNRRNMHSPSGIHAIHRAMANRQRPGLVMGVGTDSSVAMTCPKVVQGAMCSGRYYACNQDVHCALGAKCCGDACGMICKTAAPVDGAILPGSLLVSSCLNQNCGKQATWSGSSNEHNECDAIKACRRGYVCCFDGCRNICRNPKSSARRGGGGGLFGNLFGNSVGKMDKNMLLMMMATAGS